MASRYRDWIEQARADLALARTARDAGSHEWACFASQQAAEKAIKGLFGYLGGECWGHSLTKLLQDLGERAAVAEDQTAAARRLDKLYIPTRYPNGFPAGKPADYFTREDSDAAIADADGLLGWVEQQVR
jgi:HEPN domain-containing protein